MQPLKLVYSERVTTRGNVSSELNIYKIQNCVSMTIYKGGSKKEM